MTTSPPPSTPAKPPRFVPTLTQVVATGVPAAKPAPAGLAATPAAGAVAAPVWPKPAALQAAAPVATVPTASESAATPVLRGSFDEERLVETAEQLRQRILLRAQAELQLTLERQVREAVSAVALQQVASLVLSMKPALEAAVNRAVAQAVDHAVGEALAKELGLQKH